MMTPDPKAQPMIEPIEAEPGSAMHIRKLGHFGGHFGVYRPGGQPQPVVKSAWKPRLKTGSGMPGETGLV
jgi:hypothetical protein